uniref:Kazal-like domain-containing protein n=1 Tax=Thermodesulfobacterium geofontis TaxID=1295609 RepID=A0A7C4JQX6_9BACT
MYRRKIIKKLIVTLSFIIFLANSSISVADEISQKEPPRNHCKKVCIKWEYKEECKPKIPEGQICVLIPVCVEYEERCDEGPTL